MDARTAGRLSYLAAGLLVATFLVERLLVDGWVDLGCVAVAAFLSADWIVLRRRARSELVDRFQDERPIWNARPQPALPSHDVIRVPVATAASDERAVNRSPAWEPSTAHSVGGGGGWWSAG